MTASLPPTLVPPAPFGRSLLDHDDLMTPILSAEFGPLTVHKTHIDSGSSHFERRSSIVQAASGSTILDAVLEISTQALPLGFLDQLLREDVLFGQLLVDFAIPVRFADRTLYQSAKAPEDLRWGRRLTIYRKDTDERICTVDELLVSDAQLLPLRRMR